MSLQAPADTEGDRVVTGVELAVADVDTPVALASLATSLGTRD